MPVLAPTGTSGSAFLGGIWGMEGMRTGGGGVEAKFAPGGKGGGPAEGRAEGLTEFGMGGGAPGRPGF